MSSSAIRGKANSRMTKRGSPLGIRSLLHQPHYGSSTAGPEVLTKSLRAVNPTALSAARLTCGRSHFFRHESEYQADDVT